MLISTVTDPSPANSPTIRGCSQVMAAAEGGEGVWKMLVLADKGGGGVRQMLTLADEWGVWLMLKLLIKGLKRPKVQFFIKLFRHRLP